MADPLTVEALGFCSLCWVLPGSIIWFDRCWLILERDPVRARDKEGFRVRVPLRATVRANLRAI